MVIEGYADEAQGVRMVDPAWAAETLLRAGEGAALAEAQAQAQNGYAALGHRGRDYEVNVTLAGREPPPMAALPDVTDQSTLHYPSSPAAAPPSDGATDDDDGAGVLKGGGNGGNGAGTSGSSKNAGGAKGSGRLVLRAGHLVVGAPLRQGKPSADDLALGLVCAVSASAYHLRFMWRHPADSPRAGNPVGVCDNMRIDKRDMRAARYRKIDAGDAPPPPYRTADREVLEGGELAAEAAGFRWRQLADQAADVFGLPPPEPQVFS